MGEVSAWTLDGLADLARTHVWGRVASLTRDHAHRLSMRCIPFFGFRLHEARTCARGFHDYLDLPREICTWRCLDYLGFSFAYIVYISVWFGYLGFCLL